MALATGDFACHPNVDFTSTSDPSTPNNSSRNDDAETETERGRLKRRRLSSHSPPRASSPSRGHDRDSGSRHRHHHRKHHRAGSSTSITPPASLSAKLKIRRRSDAEPDHTLRGRGRNRSESRSHSPIVEGDEREGRIRKKRGLPPSRQRISEGEGADDAAVRRQRSLVNMYLQGGEGRERATRKGKEKMQGRLTSTV